jgi:predicted PurR-regulated permease PerM
MIVQRISKRLWILLITIISISIFVYWIIPVSFPLISAFLTALLLEPAIQTVQQRFFTKRKHALFVFALYLLFICISSYFLITKLELFSQRFLNLTCSPRSLPPLNNV